ncbi:hypothetical protein DKM44_08320 [Deinococcus irradiatisoli]|uniref:Uncharacterized protein n=1 Tax=Deinococcus irradiatisoli TaxID=2202254 RepID=A0A2Z3JJZ3_9DEIO|nr:hypothetical protein [Deinococcus irradiatisoli]AWN23229.1 hypothetical protein DKM44_08320 [Deinococcus irradiatisoli]
MSLDRRTRRDTLDLPPVPPPQDTPPLHAARPQAPDQRRELARRLRFERRRAVDPEELAAILEADGYSDHTLRRRYGFDSVFDAAEQLYALSITRRVAAPPPALRPIWPLPWTLLWHGPLLLLIGLAALGSVRLLGVDSAGSALAGAAVVAWGLGLRLFWLRQTAGLSAAPLRSRLLSGGVLGTLLGALAALPGQPWDVWLWNTALLGALLGGLYALTLTSAALLLALGKWRMLLQIFGAAALLAEAMWRLGQQGPVPASLFAVLLGTVAVGAALRVTRRPAPRPVGQNQSQGRASDRAAFTAPAWTLTTYGWSVAAAFVLLAQHSGHELLLLPVLLFGAVEFLAWLMQAQLRRLAARLHDPALLARAALWPVLGAPGGLLLLIAALDGAVRWAGLRPAGALSSYGWGVALLSAALLQSTWLSRHAGQWPRLTVLWAISAGLLAVPQVSWWVPILLLSLVLLLLSDRALGDLSSYR